MGPPFGVVMGDLDREEALRYASAALCLARVRRLKGVARMQGDGEFVRDLEEVEDKLIAGMVLSEFDDLAS